MTERAIHAARSRGTGPAGRAWGVAVLLGSLLVTSPVLRAQQPDGSGESGSDDATSLDALFGDPGARQNERDGAEKHPDETDNVGNDDDGSTAQSAPSAPSESIALDERQPEPPPVSRRGQIEEIVVTAQRREESLQDIPVTVSAFSGADLKDANVSESHGLQLKTPGMVYNSQGGYAHIYIRGIGSDGTIPSSEGSIATFVDGVYNPNANSSIQHFGDVERIEILKGPQGTLFGRNTTGGAINIITRQPDEQARGSLSLVYGSFDRQGASGFLSLPVTDWLMTSIAAYGETSDSYYTSINPDSPPVVDNEDWGVRGKILTRLGDGIEMLLTGYVTDHYGPDTTVANNLRASLLTQAGGGSTETSNIPYRTNGDRGPYFNSYRLSGADLKFTLAGDALEFSSISAWLDTDNSGFIELDYTEADMEEVPVPRAYTESLSQEFQLSSIWSGDWQFLLGGFYLTAEGGFDPLEIAFGPRATPNSTLSPFAELFTALGYADGVPSGMTLRTFGIIGTEAWAAFGNSSYTWWDSLTLTAGLRYSSETRDLLESRTEVQPAGAPFMPTALSSPRQDKTWSAFSPMLSLEWQPGNVLYYGKVSEGFKSGNYNPVLILEPVTPVEPEEILALEAGFKGDFFDRSLRFNLAAFWYDYEDLQVQVVSVVSSGTARLENAGNARVYGLEAQLGLAPLNNLRIDGGVSWLRSEYLEYFGTGYDETTGLAFEDDFSGNQLNRAPELTGNLDIGYTVPMPGGPLAFGVSGYYASGWFYDAQNTFEQGSYSVFGARLSYDLEAIGLRLSLVGSNLTNTEYLKNALLHDFGVSGTYAPPRQIAGRVEWNF